MNYHQTWSSADHCPYPYRLFWMSKHLAPQQKWLSEMISHVRVGVEALRWSGPSSVNNTSWCLCNSGFASRCSAEGSQFMQADESAPRLMKRRWTRPTCVFQQGSAFTLSVEYFISSYKHLLRRVQGPLFAEHLFSQMILLRSPRSGSDHRLSTLLRSFSRVLLVHLTVWKRTEVICCYDFWTRNSTQQDERVEKKKKTI